MRIIDNRHISRIIRNGDFIAIPKVKVLLKMTDDCGLVNAANNVKFDWTFEEIAGMFELELFSNYSDAVKFIRSVS